MGISGRELNPDQSWDPGGKKHIKKYRLATIGGEPGDKKVNHMYSALDHSAIQTIDFISKASYYYKNNLIHPR